MYNSSRKLIYIKKGEKTFKLPYQLYSFNPLTPINVFLTYSTEFLMSQTLSVSEHILCNRNAKSREIELSQHSRMFW